MQIEINIFKYLLFSLSLFTGVLLSAQSSANQARPVIVDDNGVMRWQDSNEEIKGFGVNYTAPFAHAYRSAKKLGIDPLKAIDQDVYHMARMGFDLFRVHVWDTEISDTLGNLIFNEHLNAFDYLIMRLKERDINFVITPIAYWGNGWPEPDYPSPGFSNKYGKDGCLTNPDAIKAQVNYLAQFINHVNPYTGIAYKDEPNLVAVEVSNEPHHREAPEKVTAFVKKMVEALKGTGLQKPVFYNASHSVHLAESYFDGGIDGGTFQWYPTGLVYGQELSINALLNVDDYDIPFEETFKKNKGAKLVYEFDAADIGKSYVYPAMARSFRTAGIQIATHFSYDPMFLAYANTEYNTHHMNLAYTPKKALSLMICAEIFHQIPMYKDFGHYPDNTSFDGFMVSYEKDLAMYNGEIKYFHTNSTEIAPKNESTLTSIAGSGNSPIIRYDGTGAYFLDRLDDGVWRLEVMPDVLIINNPYGRNSLDKKVAVIQWNERKMNISLKDLGQEFSLSPLNKGNQYQTKTSNGAFEVNPGVYLLKKKNLNYDLAGETWMGNIKMEEFVAPTDDVKKAHLIHHPPQNAIKGTALQIKAQLTASERQQVTAELWFNGKRMPMLYKRGFEYEATIPADQLEEGFLSYYIVVKDGKKTTTFPAAKEGTPYQWDFYDRKPYTIKVLGSNQPIYLFNAYKDSDQLSRTRWINTLKTVPLDHPSESEYQVNVEELFRVDAENLNGPAIHNYTIKTYLNEKVNAIRPAIRSKQKIVVKARALNNKATPVQIAFTTSTGLAFGKVITLQPEMATYEIAINELEQVDLVTMPRPYPSFLPFYFQRNTTTTLDLSEIDGLQFSLGPGIKKKELDDKHGFAIVSVYLQ